MYVFEINAQSCCILSGPPCLPKSRISIEMKDEWCVQRSISGTESWNQCVGQAVMTAIKI